MTAVTGTCSICGDTAGLPGTVGDVLADVPPAGLVVAVDGAGATSLTLMPTCCAACSVRITRCTEVPGMASSSAGCGASPALSSPFAQPPAAATASSSSAAARAVFRRVRGRMANLLLRRPPDPLTRAIDSIGRGYPVAGPPGAGLPGVGPLSAGPGAAGTGSGAPPTKTGSPPSPAGRT